MSLDRSVLAFAGIMVLLSVALTAWVSPLFVWLTVFVGLNLLLFALIRSIRGHYGPAEHDHLGVEIPGIYWHFVDVMWIVVYTTIYIL